MGTAARRGPARPVARDPRRPGRHSAQPRRGGLATGVLDALADTPVATSELAARTSAVDVDLLAAFLRVLAAAGLIQGDGGGPARRDVVEDGEVIARVSAAFDPFVDHLLVGAVREQRPRRVLDVGCGAGLQLATMLATAPRSTGVGIDSDGAAAKLAAATLERRGLAGRATVLETDVRTAAAERGGPLAEPVDLLLRAQEGALELPDAAGLAGQLIEAGLRPEAPARLAPGAPVIAVQAVLPG